MIGSKEHIFPKAIGGHSRLPDNAVSQEANNKFSRIEHLALTKGIIGLRREVYGTSKQLNLGRIKKKKRQLKVLLDLKNNRFRLDHVINNKSMVTEGINYDLDKKVITAWCGSKKDYDSFMTELSKVNESEFQYIKFPSLVSTHNHTILFARYKTKNKDYWYCSKSHEIINTSHILEKIIINRDRLLDRKHSSFFWRVKNGMTMQILSQEKDIDKASTDFLYCKIAFNALCAILIQDGMFNVIFSSKFDTIREAISLNNNCENFTLKESVPEKFKDIVSKYYDSRIHYVLVVSNQNGIVAYIKLYDIDTVKITLTCESIRHKFDKIIICYSSVQKSEDEIIDLKVQKYV